MTLHRLSASRWRVCARTWRANMEKNECWPCGSETEPERKLSIWTIRRWLWNLQKIDNRRAWERRLFTEVAVKTVTKLMFQVVRFIALVAYWRFLLRRNKIQTQLTASMTTTVPNDAKSPRHCISNRAKRCHNHSARVSATLTNTLVTTDSGTRTTCGTILYGLEIRYQRRLQRCPLFYLSPCDGVRPERNTRSRRNQYQSKADSFISSGTHLNYWKREVTG